MTRSGLVAFHHAGYFSLADTVDSADGPADFSGHPLRLLFRIQVELYFQVHIGARHILIIRRRSYDTMKVPIR